MIAAPIFHFPISATRGLCAHISFLFAQNATPLFFPSGDGWIGCRDEMRWDEKRKEGNRLPDFNPAFSRKVFPP